jgi:hypothetical protein
MDVWNETGMDTPQTPLCPGMDNLSERVAEENKLSGDLYAVAT